MQLHALKYDTEFNYMILLQSRHTQHSCTVYYLHSNIKWHKSHRDHHHTDSTATVVSVTRPQQQLLNGLSRHRRIIIRNRSCQWRLD